MIERCREHGYEGHELIEMHACWFPISFRREFGIPIRPAELEAPNPIVGQRGRGEQGNQVVTRHAGGCGESVQTTG